MGGNGRGMGLRVGLLRTGMWSEVKSGGNRAGIGQESGGNREWRKYYDAGKEKSLD